MLTMKESIERIVVISDRMLELSFQQEHAKIKASAFFLNLLQGRIATTMYGVLCTLLLLGLAKGLWNVLV
jgi:hypothetical protein